MIAVKQERGAEIEPLSSKTFTRSSRLFLPAARSRARARARLPRVIYPPDKYTIMLSRRAPKARVPVNCNKRSSALPPPHSDVLTTRASVSTRESRPDMSLVGREVPTTCRSLLLNIYRDAPIQARTRPRERSHTGEHRERTRSAEWAGGITLF